MKKVDGQNNRTAGCSGQDLHSDVTLGPVTTASQSEAGASGLDGRLSPSTDTHAHPRTHTQAYLNTHTLIIGLYYRHIYMYELYAIYMRPTRR